MGSPVPNRPGTASRHPRLRHHCRARATASARRTPKRARARTRRARTDGWAHPGPPGSPGTAKLACPAATAPAQARAGGPVVPVWMARPAATAPPARVAGAKVPAGAGRPGRIARLVSARVGGPAHTAPQALAGTIRADLPRAQALAQAPVASLLRLLEAPLEGAGPPAPQAPQATSRRRPGAVPGACGDRSAGSRLCRDRPTRCTRPVSSRRGTARPPGLPGSATRARVPPARATPSPGTPRSPSATRPRTRPRRRPGRSSTMISSPAAGHRRAPNVTGARTAAIRARSGGPRPTAQGQLPQDQLPQDRGRLDRVRPGQIPRGQVS